MGSDPEPLALGYPTASRLRAVGSRGLHWYVKSLAAHSIRPLHLRVVSLEILEASSASELPCHTWLRAAIS